MNDQQIDQINKLFKNGEYSQLLTLFKDLNQTTPDDPELHYWAGMACRFSDRFDEAIAYYDKAVKLKPDTGYILLALGIAQQLAGHFSNAVQTLENAIRSDPTLAAAYNSLGLTYKKVGKFHNALEWYDKGAEILCQHATDKAHEDPSKCYIDEEINGEKIRKMLPYVLNKTKEILKSTPDYAAIKNNMGVCFAELGDVQGARDAYREAIEMTPDGYNYPNPIINLRELDGE